MHGPWYTRLIVFLIAASAVTTDITCIARAPYNDPSYGCSIVIDIMLQHIIALITIASLCLLGALLSTTTPASAGPFGLLVIFISAYLACLGLISFFLYGISRVMVYASAGFTVRRPFRVLPFRRAYYFSTVLAAAPVLLIGLQSVGGVGFYEFLLVIIFVGIGCLYVAKRMR